MMEVMITAVTARPTQITSDSEQLTLLPSSAVNARFALSKSTRERGLRHVAEIRQQLAERDTVGAEGRVRYLPTRRDWAA
jgi:hypothetical protein